MRPSTTEPLQTVAESLHGAQTDLGCVRNQDVFACGSDTAGFAGNVDCRNFDQSASPGVPTPTTDRRRADCRLSRRPSKLSLGSLSLTAAHPYSFSPVSLSRGDSGRGSFRQRSQSDVIRLATMASWEMKRTMEATRNTERTLQASISELDEALSRLKVIASGRQRAASMRHAKRPTHVGVGNGDDGGHGHAAATTPRGDRFDGEEPSRPLTTEPPFFSLQQEAMLAGELATPLSIHSCMLVQSPRWGNESAAAAVETTSGTRVARPESSQAFEFEFPDDWDAESSDEADGGEGVCGDDDVQEVGIDAPVYIVLTFCGGRSVLLAVDEFQRWLSAQDESWC